MPSLSGIAFDAREARIIAGLARWMGMLGRFQILASTFLFVMLLAVAGLVTATEVLEPSTAAGEAPLVSVGDISRPAIAVVVAVVVGFSLVFFRGGMLLISAAEDLETVDDAEKNTHHIEDALRHLRGYFVLESILIVAIAGAVYAATILSGA